MAMSITGGSGTGNLSVVSAPTTFTLFTTPNTANTMFIVTWHIATDHDKPIVVGNNVAPSYLAFASSVTTEQAACPGVGSAEGVIKVGPNTPVRITVSLVVGGSSVTAVYDYNYVAITFA